MDDTNVTPSPIDLKLLARAVALVRAARGYTQESFADILQCGSKFIVQQIESEQPVDEQWLNKLPQALECDPPTMAALLQEGEEIADVLNNRTLYGEAVRALRKEKGWIGQDLAKETGCGINTISKIEKGKVVNIEWLFAASKHLVPGQKGVQAVLDAAVNMKDPVPDDLILFGQCVSALRQHRKMTMEELGQAARPPCSKSTINRIEAGYPIEKQKWRRSMAAALQVEAGTMQGVIEAGSKLIEELKLQEPAPPPNTPPAVKTKPSAPNKPRKPPSEKKPTKKIAGPELVVEKVPEPPSQPVAAPAPATTPDSPWAGITKLMRHHDISLEQLSKMSAIPPNIIQDAIDGTLQLGPQLMKRLPPVFGKTTLKQLVSYAATIPDEMGGGKGNKGKPTISANHISPTDDSWEQRITKSDNRGRDFTR